MSNFLKDIIKETGNEYATLVSEGVDSADVTSFIDTGSYSFNALLSGSIYKGMPGNKLQQSLVRPLQVKHFLP